MATRIRLFPVSSTPEEIINTRFNWVYLKLKKESSGHVVFGTSQELMPVESGRGISLMADEWTDMLLSPSTILYVAAPTNEQIAIVEQIVPLNEIVDALIKLSTLGGAQNGGAGRPQAGDPFIDHIYVGGR